MGTRADFYVGRGKNAEWLGSIAWDGYPDGITLRSPDGSPESVKWAKGKHLFDATTENQFRNRLARFFEHRSDVTLPAQGWPWPWENSLTTDYSYAFDKGVVWATSWGYRWWRATRPKPDVSDNEKKVAVFPDMRGCQNVTLGSRPIVTTFTLAGDAGSNQVTELTITSPRKNLPVIVTDTSGGTWVLRSQNVMWFRPGTLVRFSKSLKPLQE